MKKARGHRLLDLVGTDADWVTDSACRSLVESGELTTDDFYPSPGQNVGRAIRVACDVCPVQVQCLEYALEAGEPYGVWGGASERERRRIRRKRSAERKRVA